MSDAIAVPPRRQRADAKQNLDALLDAAKAAFATEGVAVPAKTITDRAGVGVGTLYRHFPRRSDLIVAVLQHEIDALLAAADELLRAADPWAAMEAWILRFTAFVATKHGLATALHSGDPAYEGLPRRLLSRLAPAMDALLARAADEGLARTDLSGREILTSVALLCQPVRDEPADLTDRIVRTFVAGLRAPVRQR